MKVADLEKQLLQKDKDLAAIRVRLRFYVAFQKSAALEMDTVRNDCFYYIIYCGLLAAHKFCAALLGYNQLT